MTRPPDDLRRELDGIGNYLDAAQEVIAQGHMPDMMGLDQRVAALCAALEQAEPDIQQECLPRLGGLLDKLDACEAAIRTFQARHEKETRQ